ncbi:hypothetical protein [Nesterenkonia muleiensis]|uniref:hypothetical protein n=1 Tax=Nesterenkonia muleiensis TaxID=2282648 RepID=UPI0013008694|nr:hypothetical protein [Nesterenkonia muleiensis]
MLADEISDLRAEARSVDADEDASFGPGKRSDADDDITGAGNTAADKVETACKA